jgi:hypothetical protein
MGRRRSRRVSSRSMKFRWNAVRRPPAEISCGLAADQVWEPTINSALTC